MAGLSAAAAVPIAGYAANAVKGVIKTASASADLAQTGGRLLKASESAAAEAMYNTIRTSTHDVADIAAHTGIKEVNIQKVKDHIFNKEHLLDRYGDTTMRRFDADPAIANSWNRLRSGNGTSADRAMLRHEAAEAHSMRKHGPSYSKAHDAVSGRFPFPFGD
jgi:hypothetical protein